MITNFFEGRFSDVLKGLQQVFSGRVFTVEIVR